MQENTMRLLYGNGSDITNEKAVQRRAQCKLITQTTMLKLIDVAKEKGANDRIKAYWNTYHCQNILYTANSRIYAPHCKNRFCTYCAGIRKAELIHKYLPVLQIWEEPYFVTLTIKAVRAKDLQKAIKKLNRGFTKLTTKYRIKARKDKAAKLMGIKSVECNFNPKNRTYNPHLHLIVPNRQMAERIIDEWLTLWTKKYTHRDAQNMRKVADREKDLIEVIKYETKVFTEPDGKKSRGKKRTAKIYIRALDNIHTAMKGCRIIDRFGFNVGKRKKEKTPCILTDNYREWKYDLKSGDWLNEEYESTLIAFVPDAGLESILQNHIDTTLE